MPGRDVVARARHRHGRRRPRAAGRVAEVGHRRAAAHRPRRPQRRRHLQGPHLPEVPRRPARVRGRRPAHARGPDRDDRRPAQPARRARPADRRDGGLGEDEPLRGRRAARAARPHLHLRRAVARAARERARHARRPLPVARSSASCAPRIVWDRVAGTIRARKGARALAITNAGTIPDRGLFSVNLPDGRRVGELDEEMVYEARPGQVFLLGASTLADRGDHARPRDRHARAGRAGRGAVLEGRRRRAPARARRGDRRVRALGGRAGRRRRSSDDYDLDPLRRAATSSSSCASSRTATRVVPSDRTIVIERFRDEIGDWRAVRPLARSAAACTPPGASR